MVEINLHGGDGKGLIGFASGEGHFFGRFSGLGRDGLGKLAAGDPQVDLDIGTRSRQANHGTIGNRQLGNSFAIDIGAIGANVDDLPSRTTLA
jgi:hypothetical protein